MKRFILLSLLLALLVPANAKKMSSQIDTMVVQTKNLDSPMTLTVAVPARYLSTMDNTRYPVVYLLNGYSGGYQDYRKNMRLDSLANIHNIIIICTDGRDSWYWDSPVDKSMQMESCITKDVVPAVDRELRTRPEAASRAIAGLSMGGHGALWLAIRHSDIFGSAGSMSGGVDITPEKFRNSWKMKKRLGEYNANPKRWKNHSVISLVPSLKPSQLNLIICCGSEDFFFQVNENLHRDLNTRGIQHKYIITPGNHSWPYWRATLPVILDFFDDNLVR